MTTLDPAATRAFVHHAWGTGVLPALTDYIRIPAKSPNFDPQWRAHGHLDRAVALVEGWCRARPVEGLHVEVARLEGRTPVIVAEVPGRGDGTVLLYGHCDKQPEMVGWEEGLGPWTPVRRGDRLYGRGAADDGYAAFAALTAIQALQEQGVPHGRCVLLIEACEESGSYDLPAYVEALAGTIGTPDLVVEIVSRSSVEKDIVLLRRAYRRAGIPEYWLIEARGESIGVELLVLRGNRYVAAPARGGWRTSPVLGRRVRLERSRNRMGRWRYQFVSAPTGS